MSKLAGMGSLIEPELYSALSSLTVNFDMDRYIEVYSASVLQERGRSSHHEASTSSSKTYEQLCQNLDNDDVLTTLRELGFVICRALIAYHAILKYHSEEEDREKMNEQNKSNNNAVGKEGSILNSLLAAKDSIFSFALEKFTIFIQSCDFAFLKFDILLDIVDMANRFTDFGQKYFLAESSNLISSVEKQIVTYFLRYHRERMDELAMFLENEIFTLCPVPYQFTIFDLQICTFFTQVDSSNDRIEVPKKLESVLQIIKSHLLPPEVSSPKKSADNFIIHSLPQRNPVVQLNFPDQLFGLNERVIAVESLEFVARQLDLMRPVIESLIPINKSGSENQFSELELNLEEFYSKILTVIPEVRLYVFDCVASGALKLQILQNSVANTKWDTNQLQSQHSQYADFLLKDFEAFKLRLDTIATESSVNFSIETKKLLWDRVIYYAFKTLVQGYFI
ncbi:hypothetical protein WR25_07528 isoform E [Diploscapter pachys]|uniref:Uncharacterized protein n=1 Tax=Diploscapter pachys TaxID=2018661 RepID=A0A2A2JK42_9BILA|nr:hypothetical protein WR25_07528 isoform A [Diploscapter pachys]PAV62136.1 hypothetical protein WR25_07528 isoform E [Diploscapter pachys]